jgi:hypothetical protein
MEKVLSGEGYGAISELTLVIFLCHGGISMYCRVISMGQSGVARLSAARPKVWK